MSAAVVIFLVLFARGTNVTERHLDRMISGSIPSNAINFLRRNMPAGPLYNNLNWGGFLMWYMPDFPVAVDGRNDLYGDDLDRSSRHPETPARYTTDPYLSESGVVLLDRDPSTGQGADRRSAI